LVLRQICFAQSPSSVQLGIWTEYIFLLFRLPPPFRYFAHGCFDIRFRSELRDQFFDLTLGFICRALQKFLSLGLGEVLAKKRNAAQMKAPVGEHLEKHWVLS
jgi:hypothetical protein